LGHRRIFRLPDATGGLPQLWGDHRTSPVGLRQQSANVLVSTLFGHVGETAELEGDSEHFRNQLDQGFKRLLYVRKDRSEESLNGFFNLLDSKTIAGIKYACTDMWPAYLKVLKERASATLNILDRFHIAKKFGEALDKVRAEEARQMHRDGYESVLKNSRWSILKRRSNLTTKQTVKLRELLKYNLRTVKAYLMREDFHRFWTYTSPAWASKFLREWCTRASHSRIEPMQKIAKMLRKHEQLLLNWFESQGLSSGIVEGFNNKAKLTMRKAYGFKDVETISIALYHQFGNLPEPKRTHKFC
jgi:transposase